MCDTMDKLQVIISRLTPDGTEKKTSFFQIDLLGLESDGAKESMLIIHDISERVLG